MLIGAKPLPTRRFSSHSYIFVASAMDADQTQSANEKAMYICLASCISSVEAKTAAVGLQASVQSQGAAL